MKQAIDILNNLIVNGGVGYNPAGIEEIAIPLADFDAAIRRGLSIAGWGSVNFERDATTNAPDIIYRLGQDDLGNLGHFTISRLTERSIIWGFGTVPTPTDTELENWLKKIGKTPWGWLAKQREWADLLRCYELDGSRLSEAERLKLAREFLYKRKRDHRYKILVHICEMLKHDALYRIEPPTQDTAPAQGKGVGGDELPPILLNGKEMKQYYKDYSPQSAKTIIESLPHAERKAEAQSKTLTVTILAKEMGYELETVSRYLGAFKKAGFYELLRVKLPGR